MSARTDTLTALIAGSVLLSLSLAPSPASAETKCKDARISGTGLTEDQAVSNWSSKVRKSYGASWSNFNIARGKSASQTALPAATLYFITASPCRHT